MRRGYRETCLVTLVIRWVTGVGSADSAGKDAKKLKDLGHLVEEKEQATLLGRLNSEDESGNIPQRKWC